MSRGRLSLSSRWRPSHLIARPVPHTIKVNVRTGAKVPLQQKINESRRVCQATLWPPSAARQATQYIFPTAFCGGDRSRRLCWRQALLKLHYLHFSMIIFGNGSPQQHWNELTVLLSKLLYNCKICWLTYDYSYFYFFLQFNLKMCAKTIMAVNKKIWVSTYHFLMP